MADVPSGEKTERRPAARTPAGGIPDPNPRRIPAINFHSAETIWDERQLGDVQARLEKLETGLDPQTS